MTSVKGVILMFFFSLDVFIMGLFLLFSHLHGMEVWVTRMYLNKFWEVPSEIFIVYFIFITYFLVSLFLSACLCGNPVVFIYYWFMCFLYALLFYGFYVGYEEAAFDLLLYNLGFLVEWFDPNLYSFLKDNLK